MWLPLAARNGTIALKHEDANGDADYVNLDFCTVPPYPEVITVKVESAALYDTIDTNQDHRNYSGSDFVDGMTSTGAGVELGITVPKDGSYETSVHYCSDTQAMGDLDLYVSSSHIGTIPFGSIGRGWSK